MTSQQHQLKAHSALLSPLPHRHCPIEVVLCKTLAIISAVRKACATSGAKGGFPGDKKIMEIFPVCISGEQGMKTFV